MNYKECLNFIHSRDKFGIRLGLDTVSALAEKVGNPQKKLKFIHVGGTNGKGSTSSFISNILSSSSLRVGKYISPYVYSFTERIQINNEQISEDDLAKHTKTVKDAVEKYNIPATEFEVITVVGFLYFAEKNCDFVVLEVGMGGRFDATNIIDPPSVCVITSISIDHTAYLGNTISEIAFEKCGIIKKGSFLVSYADNPDEANNVILKTAEENGVLYGIPDMKDIEILSQTPNGTVFTYKGIEYNIKLLGKHQVYNAVSAIETAKALGIKNEFIKSGLLNTKFPGRFEIVSKKPLIIEDGAHNFSGISALKDAVKTYLKDRKITLIMSMLEDKEYEKCIEQISEISDTFIATESENPRKASAEKIKSIAEKYVKNTYAIKDVNEALSFALSNRDEKRCIIICGSLYLLGEVKLIEKKRCNL